MKKTIYFTGTTHRMGELTTEIKAATDKRDAWLSANKDLIGKIDSEDIKITPFGPNDNHVVATIQLTYYSK